MAPWHLSAHHSPRVTVRLQRRDPAYAPREPRAFDFAHILSPHSGHFGRRNGHKVCKANGSGVSDGDMRVTQVANGTWGVHAVLPAGVLT
jgi:hypothetical protein